MGSIDKQTLNVVCEASEFIDAFYEFHLKRIWHHSATALRVGPPTTEAVEKHITESKLQVTILNVLSFHQIYRQMIMDKHKLQ